MDEKEGKGHPIIRKTIFALLGLMLLLVLGRVAVEAFSFIAENSAKVEVEGQEFIIKGGICSHEGDNTECCMEVCTLWCSTKDKSALKAGVFASSPAKCECTCSV